MSQMVEMVAGAILAEVPEGYGMTNDEARRYARAALETMRHPTDAMLHQVQDVVVAVDIGTGDHEYHCLPGAGRDVFRAMIDAALSEEETRT